MTYDIKCYALAAHFLYDETPEVNTEANRVELAELIQSEIEDTIEYSFKRRLTAALPSRRQEGV